mgnify:CR=1 FL=1
MNSKGLAVVVLAAGKGVTVTSIEEEAIDAITIAVVQPYL